MPGHGDAYRSGEWAENARIDRERGGGGWPPGDPNQGCWVANVIIGIVAFMVLLLIFFFIIGLLGS